MSNSPETTHGILPSEWKATFSIVRHAETPGSEPQETVICTFTTHNYIGQHGFEIDRQRRVIGHEPYRYVGASLQDRQETERFAQIMGLPQPVPPLHEIASNMPELEAAFLNRIRSGEHPLHANQNVWQDVVFDRQAPQDMGQVGD